MSVDYKKDLIEEPNYTQVPNIVFKWQKTLTPGEFSALLFLCRQTFGFHRPTCKVSLSQISDGINCCKKTTIKHLATLEEKGLIFCKRSQSSHGDDDSNEYSLVVYKKTDSPKIFNTNEEVGVVEKIHQGSVKNTLGVVEKIHTLKESSKESFKESYSLGSSEKNAAASFLPDELKEDPIAKELVKAKMPLNQIAELVKKWKVLEVHLQKKEKPFGFFVWAAKNGELEKFEKEAVGVVDKIEKRKRWVECNPYFNGYKLDNSEDGCVLTASSFYQFYKYNSKDSFWEEADNYIDPDNCENIQLTA